MLLNPWLSRFLPGLLLGYAIKWWTDRTDNVGGRMHHMCSPPSSQQRCSQWTIKPALQEDDSDEDRVSEAPSSRGMRRQRIPAPREELKMVLVVNDELRMGKGKIGWWWSKCCGQGL